ncbi:MAG: type II toxin-antitoxin system PemK/MazF family toxin [Ignavibacteria bacterium]|nr:type II toxin-antitoxin system PemK/MazF family toxin [Ignavibacteria bacterium]
MKSTIICNKWDVVLVNFPFSDLTSTKKRPSLIVSPNEFNIYDDVIIAYITSNIPFELKYLDHLIKDWTGAGLLKPSIARMKFATIQKTFIHKKLGSFSFEDRKEFSKKIIDFFLD